jgi:Protein of unknown function (DUF2845)
MRHICTRPAHARGLTAVTAAMLLALVAQPAARADDTMRCGSVLINIGMVAPQVAAKCGMPKDKNVTEIPRRVRTPKGTVATIGTVRVERWTYDRGYGQFPAVLTFEEGKLKSIEMLTRP